MRDARGITRLAVGFEADSEGKDAMHEETLNQPMKMDVMQVPSAARSQQAFGEARRMYMRVLAGWASDALVLRRKGLDRAAWSVTGPMRRAA